MKKSKRTNITISITKHGVNFNKACLENIDYPENVIFKIKREDSLLALIPSQEDVNESVPFANGKKSINVRINNRDFTELLKSLIDTELVKNFDAFRVTGKYYDIENMVIFDFKEAKSI